MAFSTDACTGIAYTHVAVAFRDLCFGMNIPDTTIVEGNLRINQILTGNEQSDISNLLGDGNGSYFINTPLVQCWSQFDQTATLLEPCVDDNGCDVRIFKTCQLPANIDSAYDPNTAGSVNRALPEPGTTYTISLVVAGRRFEKEFTIDAAGNYTDLCDAVPLAELEIVSDPILGCSPQEQQDLAAFIATQI